MRVLSNTARPSSNSQILMQDRDFTASFTGQEAYQEIIEKANSLALPKAFKYYGVHIDQYHRKCTCPFQKHKGGRESSASFYYYPETNTFWCFGCKTGTTTVDFVANLENLTKVQAAFKALNLFADGTETSNLISKHKENYQEKTELMFNFAEAVRKKISNNTHLLPQIEEICASFDKMNNKYELDVDALKFLINKINLKLELIG